jgi:hypothetical protein
MHGESAQGTVEYVGLLLVVAVLLGALVAAFGVPSSTTRIATSLVRAFSSVLGVATPAGTRAQPSAEDEARFARATDAGVAPDDRPSLRDVRLALFAAHGEASGREIYRALVLQDLRRIVPGLAGPTRFGTIDHDPAPHGFETVNALIHRLHALDPPSGDDPGELETPLGRPNAHVVTEGEEDAAFRHALHPGSSWRSLALDGVGAIPGYGTVKGVARVTLAVARGAAAVVADLGDAENAISGLSPAASEIPPGSRAGDEVVSWTATRRAAAGATPALVRRTAVVRDGVLLADGIDVLPASTP